MFSNDKKSGGGWFPSGFLSLRRQPKKQKSLDSSKLLQKSCVDLSAAGVAASSEQDLLFRTAKPSKLKLNNNSSNNNNDDTSFTSNSCTNCCCKFSSSKTSSPSFGIPSPIDDELEQTDQLRRVLITNEENYSAAGGHEGTNFSANLLLYNKKEEFSRTTRTVTTKITNRTMVNGSGTASSSSSSSKTLHHRIGLVFNENGQLMNRRQLLNTKNRDGLIFDENGRLLSTDSDETAPLTPASSILDDSTIEFIDSSTQNSDIYNRANMQHNIHKCSCNGSKMTLTNSSSILSNTKSDWSSSNNNRQVIRRCRKDIETDARSEVKEKDHGSCYGRGS